METASEDSILIVDDDPSVVVVLERILRKEEYEYYTAPDGETALAILRDKPVSLMLLDVILPGIDGVEVLQRGRELQPNLAALVITGVDDRTTLERIIDIGAYGYILKPFHSHEVGINVINALKVRKLEIENRKYRHELENLVADRTREIEEERKNIEEALVEVSGLITELIKNNDFSLRFDNPNLPNCSDVQQCERKECPCFQEENVRCWQVAGTYCGGRPQGAFAEKYEDCSKCPVYQPATSDHRRHIGELFNNMMHMLETNYKDLQDSQARIIQQEKMASIGQLAAGVAHEINNPVGFITSNLGSLANYIEKLQGFIEFLSDCLEKGQNDEQQQEVLKQRKKLKIDYVLEDIGDLIQESSDGCSRIKTIVADLKSFSRNDAAKAELVDVNEVIESTLNIVWNELKYKTEVVKEFGELSHTLCFPQQLSQVFMNILVNAAHSIEKQGTITIETTQHDQNILINISDTGQGIPPGDIKRLFEPFFTTKGKGKGTGLGLSISYDIIKKHNGDIVVESEVGKGTTFTVKLPVAEQ